MAKLSNVIIHCSDSEFGNAAEIRRWHLANKWSDIGYHFVINNGLLVPETKYQKKLYLATLDGSIETGRKIDGDTMISDNEAGAHALGYNSNSIGICLIGVAEFTPKQFLSLARLLRDLENTFGPLAIKGHYEVCDNRTCPNFNVPLFLRDMPLYLLQNHYDFLPGRYAMKVS